MFKPQGDESGCGGERFSVRYACPLPVSQLISSLSTRALIFFFFFFLLSDKEARMH